MTTAAPIDTVIVGLDESSHARAALEWGCDLVGPTGTVHAVHATTAAQADAGRLARDVRAWINELDGAPTIMVEEHEGDPCEVLLGRAEALGADVIVVGVHDQRRLTPRRLGSTLSDLIRRTTGAVAIVGADPPTTPGQLDEIAAVPVSVVVGIDDGAASRDALRWAATYARSRSLGLELVRALPNRPVFGTDGLLDVMAFYIDRDLARQWALEDLEELADEVRQTVDGDLAIAGSATRGATGHLLVEASRGAALLVLGLGSGGDEPGETATDEHTDEYEVPMWLHHAVTRAPCPVVVVPG